MTPRFDFASEMASLAARCLRDPRIENRFSECVDCMDGHDLGAECGAVTCAAPDCTLRRRGPVDSSHVGATHLHPHDVGRRILYTARSPRRKVPPRSPQIGLTPE